MTIDVRIIMTCKGICIRHKAPRPVISNRYSTGQKRCQMCEILKWVGLWVLRAVNSYRRIYVFEFCIRVALKLCLKLCPRYQRINNIVLFSYYDARGQ